MNAFSRAFIEPLEARIAPALFQTGLINHPASPTSGEIDYTDANGGAEDNFFVNTEADPNDPISALIGPGEPLVADTFYAKLRTTDLLKVFNNTGFQPLISGDVLGNAGITGNIVAFFVDKNLDNEVQLNELTGLALGNKVQAIISGSVDGDVVSNLNDQTGRIGGAAETIGTGTDLLQNKIADVNIAGDVNGAVASGGEIKALKVNGQVNRVIAGTAANGYQYDFNSAAIADGGDTLNVAAPGVGVKGVSIGKTTVGDLSLRTLPGGGEDGGIMQAGDGGAGAAGGSLTAITILADATGFVLQGGSGGAGTGSIATGGAGGAIKNVIVNGLDIGSIDLTANSLMLIKSGGGGEGAASAQGGKGGVVQDIFVGFESVGSGAPRRSVTAMSDEVVVQGGDGGAGLNGGKGGAAKNVSVFAAPTGSQNNIEVLGGVGGATKNSSGKAGVGGAVTTITALNPSTDAEAENSKILLRGGDGGSAAAGGAGAKGGKIENADLIGFQHELRGGQGSAGTTGGNGGTLKDIVLTDGAESVRPQNVLLDGGVAGIGLNGKGGNGGKVKDVTILNSDLITLDINSTVLAADGAASKRGTGGKGGTVSNLFITELDTANPGIARIRGGNGGAGGDVAPAGGAGGKAGNVVDATIAAVSLDLTASGGNGGNATLNGKGGKGGLVESLFFSSFQQEELPSGGTLTEVFATVNGGIGGNGAGSGAGGKGGDVNDSSVTVGRAVERLVGGIRSSEVDGGAVSVTGGKGGDALSAAGGKGGSVLKSTFTSFAGDVASVAGNAGAGTKGAKGGKVNDISIDVGNQVTVMGGDGTGGGAGGTINNIGFSRAVETTDVVGTITAAASPAPLGAVTIIAGDGSTAGPKAGAGGSVTDATGFVGITGITTIEAGVGAASATKAAAGGSIVDLSLFGGGGEGAELRIQAGNASNSASASVGGAGGDVKNVGIGINAFDVVVPENPANASAIHPDTIVRHIAAGNGGNTGSGKGGVGGSVINLNTHVDIGLREGEAFGYSTMGGLFAGSGGTAPRAGKAGSILGVTADAIAAIVAGRPEIGATITTQNMATKVDDIILNGLENPTFVDENGTYANIDTANLIGGVKDPAAVGVPYDPDNNPGTPQVSHPHANTFDETDDPATTEFVDNDNNDGFSLGDTTTENTDGFVAAISYIDNLTNVRAEAVLTMVNGVPTFIDLNNLNGQRVQLTP